MLIENELEEKLNDRMFKTWIDYTTTGSSPSFVAERDYGMLYALMGDRMPQEYVTMMVLGYYLPQADYRLKGVPTIKDKENY